MILADIKKILSEDGMFVSTTSGVSMYPLLRDRRDTVIVTPTAKRLKKYDVALFLRGDSYVLHRVIKVLPDSYLIRGDNCIMSDKVMDADILGKLTGIYRGDNEIDMQSRGYKTYSRLIVFFSPIVRLKLRLKFIFNRIKNKK